MFLKSVLMWWSGAGVGVGMLRGRGNPLLEKVYWFLGSFGLLVFGFLMFGFSASKFLGFSVSNSLAYNVSNLQRFKHI